MQSIEDYLRVTCKLNDKITKSTLQVLEDQGFDTLETLLDQSEEDLKGFGLTGLAAKQIVKNKPINPEPPKSSIAPPDVQKDKHEEVKREKNPVPKPSKDEEEKNQKPLALKVGGLGDFMDETSKFVDTSTKRPLPKKNSASHADDSKLMQYILYDTYEDLGSEYKMYKKRLNDENFKLFCQQTPQSEYQIFGFYGAYQNCLATIAKILKVNTKDLLIQPDIPECIVAYKLNDKVALLYKTNDEVYDFDKKVESSGLINQYIRDLVDLCPDLVFCTSDKFQINPDLQSPFQDNVNPAYHLQETLVEPDDKLQFRKLEADGYHQIQYQLKELRIPKDLSKMMYKVDIKKQYIHKEFSANLQNSDVFSTVKQYENHKLSIYKLAELKRIVQTSWVKDGGMFLGGYDKRTVIIGDRLNTVFSAFVPFERLDEFKSVTRELNTNFDESYQKLYQEMDDIMYSNQVACSQEIERFLNETCNCNIFKKKIEENDFGFFKKHLFGIEDQKCNYNCEVMFPFALVNYNKTFNKSLDWELIEKNLKEFVKGHFSFKVHHSSKKLLKDQIKKINDTAFDFKIARRKQLDEDILFLRRLIIDKFIDSTSHLIKNTHEHVQQQVQIKFWQMTFYKDKEQVIQSWTISKLSDLFPDSSKFLTSELTVQNVVLLNENNGLVLFSSPAENKSQLFQFSIGKGYQQGMNLIQSYPSANYQIAAEPNLGQYFLYDNSLKRFSLGKINSSGKLEDSVPQYIYDLVIDGQKITKIQDASFLPFHDKIILINEEGILFEYKWTSKSLSVIQKKVNKDSVIQKTLVKPQYAHDKYQEIQTTYEGKIILIRCKESIDCYDMNWDRIYQHPIKNDFKFFKIIAESNRNYLIIQGAEAECFEMIGFSAQKLFKSQIEGQVNKSVLGNPFLDQMSWGFRKFGPHSNFIGAPIQTNLTVVNFSQTANMKLLQKYFVNLQLRGVSFDSTTSDLKNKNFSQTIQTEVMRMILMTRIPIHVATVENSSLTPLENGVNKTNQFIEGLMHAYKEKSVDLIEQIMSKIKFGVYEEFLQNQNQQISVISIVGRQSSGKSYVMNRFFGTRFGVAATRCTDGIWMSLSRIYRDEDNSSKLFLVLDCEGLFSSRRNDVEEMKLCLALSAISDIMILNQDLSFNRYLNSLFNNFSKSIGRIKGKRLFKGKLMMLVRDVKSEEALAAYQELYANINQLQNQKEKSFLSQVFNGQLISQCLNYFQLPIFDTEIETTRERHFLSLVQGRWTQSNDLVESFKITLAQIFADDDSDLDEHRLKIKCEKFLCQALEMFEQAEQAPLFCEDDKEFVYKQVEEDGAEYEITINHNDIRLAVSQEEETKRDDDEMPIPLILLQMFQDQTYTYNLKQHNRFLENFKKFLTAFLDHRKKVTEDFFIKSIPNDEEFLPTINSYTFKLKSYLEQNIAKLNLCCKTCRGCDRICDKAVNHIGNCDCRTLHICQEPCQISDECAEKGYLCIEKYGHKSDHRCDEGSHKCGQKCLIEDCMSMCNQEKNHGDELNHNCGNKHPCNTKCQDSFCTRTCNIAMDNPHDLHNCGDTKCIHKCKFCDKHCIFPNHMHQDLIEKGEVDTLTYIAEGTSYTLDHHTCGCEHQCLEQCNQDGICNIEYKIYDKVWTNELSEFEYKYFEPVETRNECTIKIPQYMNGHHGSHDCKIKNHRCDQQCMECKSFCNKAIGHDGLHGTKTHRNKERSVFVSSSSKKIQFVAEGVKREYKVGESCQPENCSQSCARRGRSHFHLKECKGGDECEAKFNPQVRHSSERYHPFEDKEFDVQLCINYWNSIDWECPADGEALEIIPQCNYGCAHEEGRGYCSLAAWHDGEHKIECGSGRCAKYDKIDVVFCIDATGSMSSYIAKAKETITVVINNFQKKNEHLKFLFGVVFYRDHPPQDSSFVTSIINLTSDSEAIKFAGAMGAAGGGDGPEAVLDGLYDSTNKMTWRKDSYKYIFHIADAPPHGKEYVTGGDGFPDGCPCMYTIGKIAANMKELQIRYKLLKIGSYVNKMADVFKTQIPDFEEQDLNSAQDLTVEIPRILVRDIVSDLDIMIS